MTSGLGIFWPIAPGATFARANAAADASPVEQSIPTPASSHAADRSHFMSFIGTFQFIGRQRMRSHAIARGQLFWNPTKP
jgi:hypothetical protein